MRDILLFNSDEVALGASPLSFKMIRIEWIRSLYKKSSVGLPKMNIYQRNIPDSIIERSHDPLLFTLLTFLTLRPFRINSAQLGLFWINSAQLGPFRINSAQLGPFRINSAQLGPFRINSVQLGPFRINSAQLGQFWINWFDPAAWHPKMTHRLLWSAKVFIQAFLFLEGFSFLVNISIAGCERLWAEEMWPGKKTAWTKSIGWFVPGMWQVSRGVRPHEPIRVCWPYPLQLPLLNYSSQKETGGSAVCTVWEFVRRKEDILLFIWAHFLTVLSRPDSFVPLFFEIFDFYE